MKFRKHIRLKDYNYSSPNSYFVTICTKERKKIFVPKISQKYGDLFSKDVDAGLVPAHDTATTRVAATSIDTATTRVAATSIVEKILVHELLRRFPVEIDFYVFMPDHLHLIMEISSNHKGCSYSLGQIVGAFKSIATRKLWAIGYKGKFWQPNFYEHIIRTESSLDRIRNYILNNPMAEYKQIVWKELDP